MPKGFRRTALQAFSTFVLAMAAAVAPASAQFPPTPDEQDTPPLAGTPKKRNVPPPAVGGPGPSILGNWTGQLNQVGSTTPYKFEMAVSAKGADVKYPDLDCVGKLRRAAAARTAPSPSRGKETISRSDGSVASREPPSSPTAR
jgi:hypothetical protein